MNNYKFDIKEMTEQFNNATDCVNIYTNGSISTDISQQEMSEMVQKHAFKLGCKYGDSKINIGKNRFIMIDDEGRIYYYNRKYSCFESHQYKKIGLEFFSIKPVKYVTVKMSEEDYNRFMTSMDGEKWELIE